MKPTLTLTEALKEIKTLEARIQKASNAIFVGCTKKNGTVVLPSTSMNEGQLAQDISANYQSIKDLMARRNKIKTALVKANNSITVTVGSEQMSIASAIERKNSISFDFALIQSMQKQLSSALREIDRNDTLIQDKYDSTVRSLLEGKETKTQETEFEVIRTQYNNQLKLELVDPIGLEAEIKKIADAIETFQDNVDVVLSIANATNYIEI